MNNQLKITALIFAGIVGIVIYFTLVSTIFYFLAKIPIDTVTPISIFQHLANPAPFTNLQGKLFLSFGLPVVLTIFLASQIFKVSSKDQFGNSKWASLGDLKKANLLKKEGIILGKYKNQYLMNDDPTHSLLVAPTRSGKGAGIIIPTLLNWKGSLICLDIKQENYKITSGFRKRHGQDVFIWAPAKDSGLSHRYNPLDYISRDPFKQISQLQVLTTIFVPDEKSGSSFWESEARAFFVGLAIYVIDNDTMPSTIGSINRLLGTEEELGDVCRYIIKTYKKNLPPPMVKTLMNFANKAAKERSGVKSMLNSALNLWDNPAIDAVTSTSDFDIRDLRKKPISIYIGISTGQISSLAPLVRIFFEQVISILSMELPDKDEEHKVLLLMDEFHMLGKMDVMTKAFTLLAGYSTRVMAVVQGLKFLDDIYGKDKRDGILSCCAHQVFYTANDLETARYVSESCGEKTIEVHSTSQKSSFHYEAPTKNISYRNRPLITKDEVRRLPKNEAVILVEASNPVKCNKIRYWKDKSFSERLFPPPEIPSLKFINEKIPKFDLSDLNDLSKNNIDPNQIDFLKEASKDDDEGYVPDKSNDDADDDSHDLYKKPNKHTK